MAVRLRDAADERTRAVLPAIDSIQRYVRDYEAGRHAPGDLYAELYCRAFGLTRAALFGDFLSARPTLAAGESAPAEYDARSLAAWMTSTNISDDGIDHLAQAASALSQAHSRRSPAQLLQMLPPCTGRFRCSCEQASSDFARRVSCIASMRTCWRMHRSYSVIFIPTLQQRPTDQLRNCAQRKQVPTRLSRSASRRRPHDGACGSPAQPNWPDGDMTAARRRRYVSSWLARRRTPPRCWATCAGPVMPWAVRNGCTRSACARFRRFRLVMPSASASFVRSIGGDPVTRC